MTHYQDKIAKNKLDRELKALGCPYRADDFRAAPWLEGHKAGMDLARSMVRAA